ncbi:MAG TPA: LysR family transcriptional regulator [Quisquiliibacterium sp.]|nr:LysR family transcriptional regulator [Quisquiliibacterium sp.]
MSSVRLLIAFTETARRGGFAAAARELGLSASAVAKSVGRLELQLGLRLFHRTTRRVGLTQEGEALFERCRRVLDELEAIELSASQAGASATGVLRVDVPVTYGKQRIVPAVAALALEHPGLRIELRLSDQYADLIGSGLDAAVRIGEVDDSRLVARRIDRQHLGVYGSPALLERCGRPRHPREVAALPCVAFRLPHTGRLRPWTFRVDEAPFNLPAPGPHALNEGEGLVEAACAGLGLVQVPDYIAADAVRSGRLEEVLGAFRPEPTPISIVFPSNRQMPLRLRLLIDTLAGTAGTGGRR